MSFLGELKRRKIIQVAAVYAVVAWLIVQIIVSVEAPLHLPDWVDTLVIVLLAVGFPIALIVSWGFNLTADGIVREGSEDASVCGHGFKIEYVLFGVIALALVWLVYRVEFDRPQQVVDSPAIDEQFIEDAAGETPSDVLPNSIAVLPFENLSPDPDNAYFAAGIHESTLNQLAKIRDLIVIARTSILQYENNPVPIPEIAKELRVESVLEGSVRYANDRVLITAQLIDGRTGAHLWSNEFNRDLVDVFAVQAEVARHIAEALHVQLLPEEQARIESRPTESMEAYRHYLYVLSLPNLEVYPEYRPVAIEALGRAIAADPGFADAYAFLAVVYYLSPPDRYLAVDYARKAIELDPAAGVAHFVLGMDHRYYHARQERARLAFERAIDLSPNNLGVVMVSVRQLAEQSGQYTHAIRFGQRVIATMPNSENHGTLGFIYLRAGDLALAAKHLREAIRLDPSNFLRYFELAIVEYLDGNPAGAKQNLDRAVQIRSPGATVRADYMTYLYGLLGDKEHAKRYLNEQKTQFENPGDNLSETLGWAALGSGNKELALRVWTDAIESYINDDRPISLGRITRFRDNWLKDPVLEESGFLELRRRLGYEG